MTNPTGSGESEDDLELARSILRNVTSGPARGAKGGRTRGNAPGKSVGNSAGNSRGNSRGNSVGKSSNRGRGEVGKSAKIRDKDDPQPLGVALNEVADDRGWGEDLHSQAVFARWVDLVGAEVAAHSKPTNLVDTKLWVQTDSTAWATQLRLLAPDLVRRLNQELGDGSITIVEVVGPATPNWKRGPRSVRDGRGPRDTYG